MYKSNVIFITHIVRKQKAGFIDFANLFSILQNLQNDIKLKLIQVFFSIIHQSCITNMAMHLFIFNQQPFMPGGE